MPTGSAISSASDLRRADHRQRHRHALQDQRVDVDPADEGEAPVALQHRDQPAEVALPDRVVEAELQAQVRLHLGRDVRVERHLRERVARRQREHREQHDADAEQARQRDQQPAEEVVPTDARRRIPAASEMPSRYASSARQAAPPSRYQFCSAEKSMSQPDSVVTSFRFAAAHPRPADQRDDDELVDDHVVHLDEQSRRA